MVIAEAEIRTTRRPTGITPDAQPNGLPKAAASPIARKVQHIPTADESPISITVELSPGTTEVVKVSPGVLASMQRFLTFEQQQAALKDWALKERFLRKEKAELEKKPPPAKGPIIHYEGLVMSVEPGTNNDPSKAEGYRYGKPLPD